MYRLNVIFDLSRKLIKWKKNINIAEIYHLWNGVLTKNIRRSQDVKHDTRVSFTM